MILSESFLYSVVKNHRQSPYHPIPIDESPLPIKMGRGRGWGFFSAPSVPSVISVVKSVSNGGNTS